MVQAFGHPKAGAYLAQRLSLDTQTVNRGLNDKLDGE